MNDPSFIGIGVGRCGTTNMYVSVVKGSDEIQGASVKEIGFFGGEKYSKGLNWYRKQFPSNCISGEVTPWYFYRDKSARTIHKHYPNIQLILMIRNPIERLYSFFMLLWAVDRVKTNSLEMLLKTDEGKRLLREGKYVERLPVWQNLFGDNLMVIRSEDYWKNPQKYILSIYGKLGVKQEIVDNFNYKKLHRGSYKEWHPDGDIFHKVDHAKRIKARKDTDFPPVKMNPKTRDRLFNYYKKSNAELYSLTGIGWKEWL